MSVWQLFPKLSMKAYLRLIMTCHSLERHRGGVEKSLLMSHTEILRFAQNDISK